MMDVMSLKEVAQGMGGQISLDPSGRWVQRLHTDTRTLQPGDCFVALKGEKFDGHQFVARLLPGQVAAAVVSAEFQVEVDPGFPLIKVQDTLEALQRFSAFYRRGLGTRIIGVTGSSGKTSTKQMIASVLSQRFQTIATQGNLNNHIGVPLTLLELKSGTECGVIEMGMNHRGEIAALAEMAMPDIGVITNIGPAHIEHLGTAENIALEKTDLLAALKPTGVAVLNADDYWSVHYADRTSARIIWTGLTEKAQVRAEEVEVSGIGINFILVTEQGRQKVRLPLFNRVMVKNALLAAGVGQALGLSLAEICAGLEAVRLVGSRMEINSWHRGWIINDSYNANPDSAKAALQALHEFPAGKRRVALLGSMGELGSLSEALHREVGAAAVAEKVDVLLAVGPSARWIAAGAREAGWTGAGLQAVESPEEALQAMRSLLEDQDVLLVKGSRFLKLERIVQALFEDRETL